MKSLYIKEKENCTNKEMFFIKVMSGKKIYNKYLFHTDEIDVLCLPIIYKEKYYKKVCSFLKKKNVKKVYTSFKKNNPFRLYMEKNITYMEPEETFFLFYEEIISFFCTKKGMELKECNLTFICNDALLAEKYINKIYKKVKGISIYTTEPEKFSTLQKKWREKCGMDITIKGKDDKVKKYNYVYINLEKNPVFEESFFIKTNIIDIYRVYKGANEEILFHFKVNSEGETQKIIKNLNFTAYYIQKNSNFSKKHYKIVNIKKLY